jgi:hypothetical protein
MRKLIIGASIILIFISIYVLLKTVSHSHQAKSSAATAVATTPAPSSHILPASMTSTPNPPPQSTPAPTPVSALTLAPLKIRVVEHQPDQFRKGAISTEELSAIQKAIQAIRWSRNSNPKAAANEDYAAIVKECEKSSVPNLLPDLITEAVSNDYQPNNEAANVAYSTELNSDLENADHSESSNGKSAGQMTVGEGTTVDGGSTPTVSQPEVKTSATTSSPAPPPPSAEVIRSKTGHPRHRSIVRHKIVDVKTQLLTLWHKSLAEPEKSPK